MARAGLRTLPLLLAALLLSGCGGPPSVSGTVTFDGQPVDGGAITFVQEGGKERAGAEIKGGKYSISGNKTLTPGKYKVEIIWNKKTGKQLPNKNDPGTTVDETQQVLPARYNSATELSADIKSGSNSDVNFDLKPGGPIGTTPGGSGPDPNRVKAVGD